MMRLIQAIYDWLFRPARWWQFWRPQSGLVGGAIFGTVLFWVPYAVLNYLATH